MYSLEIFRLLPICSFLVVLIIFIFQKFICSIEGCSKSYTSPSHLQRHISTSHENAIETNGTLCTICGLVFSNKYNFKRHLSKHNECEFPFNCIQCSKGFKKKRQLSEHMCIHSGEYPYK